MLSLKSMNPAEDPLSAARAYHMFSTAFLYVRAPIPGNRYMKITLDVVKKAKIQFISPSETLPEFSEELHEKIVFLGHLVYSQITLRLVEGGPPSACTYLEQQFREELHVC